MKRSPPGGHPRPRHPRPQLSSARTSPMGAKKVSSDSGGDKKRIETAYREFGEYSLGRKSVTIPPSGPWLRKRTWWHGSGGISMAISGLSCGMWPCAFRPSHPLPHLAKETGLRIHMTSSTTSCTTSLRSRVLMTWSMCSATSGWWPRL